MDAAGVARAVVVAWCDMGESLILAADHPDRIAGLVLIAPPLPVAVRPPAPYSFTDVLDTDEGWAKENRHYWLRDWPGYAEFFFSQCFTEPHSTKQIEDAVAWSLETDAETMLVGFDGWDTKELDPGDERRSLRSDQLPRARDPRHRRRARQPGAGVGTGGEAPLSRRAARRFRARAARP